MISDLPVLIVLSGPTAVGKTSLAIRLAQSLSAEIISADSRQFFREMNIGTACPSPGQLAAVPHHFVRHLSIHENYNIGLYEKDVLAQLDELFLKSRFALMVGGSGLYIRAVCHGIDPMPEKNAAIRCELQRQLKEEGIAVLRERLKKLDPEYYDMVDLNNPVRLIRALEVCITTASTYSSVRKNKPAERRFRTIMIGLELPREELYHKINLRTDEMIKLGLVDEARQLYPFRHLNALNTVGYQELFRYFEGKITLESAIEKIKQNTRHFAKRQMTWLRKEPEINWFSPQQEADIFKLIKNEE